MDFASSFTHLKKPTLSMSMKLVQDFKIVGLTNTNIQMVNLVGLGHWVNFDFEFVVHIQFSKLLHTDYSVVLL